MKRNIKIKSLDYLLYTAIFGGITLVSGSIVHALQFSVSNIVFLLVGLVLTTGATYLHDSIFSTKKEPFVFSGFIISVITAVSSGTITGGILHWQESPKFALYLIISGFFLSIITTLLFSTKDLKSLFANYFIKLSIFSGMSFISGSIVHALNSWFSNFALIFIGVAMTIIASILNEMLIKKRKISHFIPDSLILLFLSLGIGGITGGILHFTINLQYAAVLISAGTFISYSAALFKNNGSLVDLRK